MTFLAKRMCYVVFLSMVMQTASANPQLLQHAQAASQAMSAMYMKALSQGSPKYQTDLDTYKQQASASLKAYQEQKGDMADHWAQRWNGFVVDLKAEYSPEYDWDVDSAVRRDARAYLSDLFQYIQNQPVYQQADYQPLLAQVEMQAITARFFDVASSYNGTVSLSPQDVEKLEPKAASKKFKQRMDDLAKAHSTRSKQIIAAKEKWEFVEDSVVNYGDQSAHFLVYATKNKIAKELQHKQVSVSLSGF